jgi:hypothetical protein
MSAIIEELRYAMRRRLMATGVVVISEFQAEGKDAPEGVDFYIRETITPLDVTEETQNSNLHQFLIDYDIFADRKVFSAITSKVYGAAETIRNEFTMNRDKHLIALPELPNCTAYLERLVQYGSASLEDDLYRLPVQIYVNVQECL